MPQWRTELPKGRALIAGQEVNADVVRQCLVINAIAEEISYRKHAIDEDPSYWGVSSGASGPDMPKVLALPMQVTLTQTLLDRLARLIEPHADPPWVPLRELKRSLAKGAVFTDAEGD